jgi:uncharacterized protein (DUF697 family)
MANESTEPTSKAAHAAEASEVERFEAIDREARTDRLIKNHVMMASAASLVPLPLFDVAAIMAVQMRLIAKLAELRGKSFSESAVRNTISGLAGGVFGHAAGVVTAISLAKVIPGIGWMLGAVSLPVVAGASTYAIGRVYARHFESGGSVYDISVDSVRAYYDDQIRKGRRLAERLRSQPSTTPPA